ncbi:Listeria/Bacterioides repeat [Candidatus Nanopelagicaceae bacterium]
MSKIFTSRLVRGISRSIVTVLVVCIFSFGLPVAMNSATAAGSPPSTFAVASGSSIVFTPSSYANSTAFNSYRFLSSSGYGWFKYVSGTTGSVTFTMTAPTGDLVMCIFDASGNTPSITAGQYPTQGCDDDSGGNGGNSKFTVTLTSGVTYYIGVCAYNGTPNSSATTINFSSAAGASTNMVTFDSNSSTSGSPSAASVTQVSTGAAVTLATQNTLARTNYTFGGWNTAADGSGTTYSAGATYTPASSLTLYAQWNSTISYDTNTATSGTAPPSTSAKSSAAVTTLATNSGTLAKTGYTFGGWNTAANGSGTSYVAGLTTYSSPGNITLYAQWNSNITYLANGSTSGTVPAVSSLYGTSGTLAGNTGTLAKTNYTITGWNTNETGTGTSYAIGGAYTPAGNRSLYAEWSTVVTYNGNSNTTGTAPATTTIKGTSGTLALNTGSLTQSGKVFAGWNTNAAGTGTWYAAGATYPNSGNITLYARWVTALAITGSSTINVGQGIAYRSDTYTATSGLDTKTVTYALSPNNAGITLETSTVTGTTYAFVRVGTSVLAGTYTDTLTATDRMGTTVNLVVTITVSSPLAWSSSNSSTLVTTAGTPTSVRLDLVNGFSGKAFTLTHMSTPSSTGITIDTSTASSGYATINVSSAVAAGTYVESITASDSSGRRIVTTVTITVNGKITVSKDGVSVGTGYTSLLYNGSTQASYLAPSTRYQVGSTYTIEWWQYQTDSSAWPRVFSMSGSYFGVSLESDTFYFWAGGAGINLGALGTTRKNTWTHMAIVSNAGNVIAYQNGIALKNAATTVTSIGSGQAPSANTLCFATQCSGTATPSLGSSGTMFGGNLANFTISTRADYSGTNTSAANFTPPTAMKIDASTVFALQATGSATVFRDLGPNNLTFTNFAAAPTGSAMAPVGALVVPELATTQGVALTSSAFTASNGTGNKTFTMTSNNAGITYAASTNQATVSIANTVTATNSATAKTLYETLTATDSVTSTLNVPIKLTINPPIALTATSITPSTAAGVALYDTVTATFGTGTKTFSVVGSAAVSGITFSNPSTNVYLMTVDKSVPQGTYVETITATDSVNATTVLVITLTVNPGLTLSSATGSTSVLTTAGKATSIRLNATYGSGTRTFTMVQAGTSQAAITFDNSTSSSGYAVINYSAALPAGNYSETVTVTDTSGGSARIVISVTVAQALTLSYNGATSGAISLVTTAGTSITTSAFTAALGTGIRTLSLSGLNSAISMDTSTANLGYLILGSGLTATNATTFRTVYETVTATDAVGFSVSRPITITVNPAISLAATATSLTTTAGISITDTITANYGTGYKTFAITSSPSIAGITNTINVTNQTTFTIPNSVGAGSYTITISATDSVGATTSTNVILNVNAGVVITGSSAISTTTGYAYNTSSYSVTGGTGSFTYALTGTLNSSYISLEISTATTFRLKVTAGAPSGSGTSANYFETVTVTDGSGAKGYINVTLTVNPIVALTGNQTINTTFGVASTYVYQTSGGTAPFNIFGSNACSPNVITDGAYTVLKFVGIGNCSWTVPNGVTALDALVVGGGGAGGTRAGGGGGAGGVQVSSGYSATPGSNISVTVGDGGKGALVTRGGGGGNSVFGSITSLGGGSGGGAIGGTDAYRVGANGGSGGGAAGYTSSASAAAGSGTSGQGFGGGLSQTNQYWPGGGGGGASSAGETPASNIATAGKGGSGYSSNITGTAVCYATGGGAGTYSNTAPVSAGLPTTAGVAGNGGDCGGATSPNGGNGTSGSSTPSAPTSNSGAGGGGSGWSSFADQVGGDGASGVVILRYVTPASITRNLITYIVDTYTATGKIVVTIPDSVTVGTYVETIIVKDSVGASTSYSITINVAKATPTVSISIPGGGSTGTYGSPVSLNAAASTPGVFNFLKSGISNLGCGSNQTLSGVATCVWTPQDTSTATISASFTPGDTINYNSVTSSNFVMSVNQADTLTVTFSNQTFTYAESGTAVSRAFTLSGLATIDSVASVATSITGTANDLTNVNVTGSAINGAAGTSTLTKAGIFTLTGTGISFSGSTKSSYYKSIAFTPATVNVNKAGNVLSFNYGSNNQVTYKPTGTDTVTAVYKGSAAPTFTTTSGTNCSIGINSGLLTTLRAGSCDVSMAVTESANYLGDTVTATVAINKAARSVTLTSNSPSLKYAETATVTTTISFASDDGVISYSNGASTGCSFDSLSGIVTANSGTATCTLIGAIDEGTNYASATSSTLTITLTKADAPVVTLIAPNSINYNPTATSASMPLPTFTVQGLKFTDAATSLSNLTVTYMNSGTYSYNSTTVPVNANTYTLTPSALSLSVGNISNYNNPTYVAAQWTISQITQDSLTVSTAINEDISVPILISYRGGTTNGTVSGEVISGGTATSCGFSNLTLQAFSTGTCLIRMKMAGNQNYTDVWSETYTVTIAKWTQAVFNFDAQPSGSTGISITSEVPFTLGEISCSTACQPTITSVSPTAFEPTDLIVITGTDFAGASQVIFNRNVIVTDLTITGNDTIAVVVPAGLAPGPGSISVVNGGKTSFRFSGLTINAQTVISSSVTG